MPNILSVADVIRCPHQGAVQLASLQSKVTSSGTQVLRPSDIFTVTGCIFTIASSPHPCVTVEWQNPAQRCSADADNVLTTASIGLCKAGDQAMQGLAIIQQTQMRASAL